MGKGQCLTKSDFSSKGLYCFSDNCNANGFYYAGAASPANVCYDPTLQAIRSDSGTISSGLVTCPANNGPVVYNCAVKTIYLQCFYRSCFVLVPLSLLFGSLTVPNNFLTIPLSFPKHFLIFMKKNVKY